MWRVSEIVYFDRINRTRDGADARDAGFGSQDPLDDVERGETIVITRDGRPIARLVPDEELRKVAAREAVAAIKAMRKGAGKITVEALLSMRDEGRK